MLFFVLDENDDMKKELTNFFCKICAACGHCRHLIKDTFSMEKYSIKLSSFHEEMPMAIQFSE